MPAVCSLYMWCCNYRRDFTHSGACNGAGTESDTSTCTWTSGHNAEVVINELKLLGHRYKSAKGHKCGKKTCHIRCHQCLELQKGALYRGFVSTVYLGSVDLFSGNKPTCSWQALAWSLVDKVSPCCSDRALYCQDSVLWAELSGSCCGFRRLVLLHTSKNWKVRMIYLFMKTCPTPLLLVPGVLAVDV